MSRWGRGAKMPIRVSVVGVLIALLLGACASTNAVGSPSLSPIESTPTPHEPSPTLAPELRADPSPTSSFGQEPAGCRTPPEDYTRVKVNGKWINGRTLAMLEYAQSLYAGPIDVRGPAITQGSYSNNGPASFGTTLEGARSTSRSSAQVGWTSFTARSSGWFAPCASPASAAWLRDWGELGEGSGIHIHAIAIGDRELSDFGAGAARRPLRVLSRLPGVPTANGVPVLDHHGGPVICQWMRGLGYNDLPVQVEAWPVDWPRPGWRETLPAVAATYLAEDQAQAQAQARRIDFLQGDDEDPSNMCGPLAAAILRDAGLLPSRIGPVVDVHNYWLANPSTNKRPWSLFPSQLFEVFSFHESIRTFDFGAWPLQAGDFVYTHAGRGEYDHMFIVTDVDNIGRAYTVTNQQQSDGTYRIERLMLYDPQDAQAGVMRGLWVQSARVGRTGLAGFEVLRRVGVSQVRGSAYRYTVEPGDTLALVAAKFDTSLQAVAGTNPGLATPLRVGQSLTVLVGLGG